MDSRVDYWRGRIRECDAADHLLYVTAEEKAEIDALTVAFDVQLSGPTVVVTDSVQ